MPQVNEIFWSLMFWVLFLFLVFINVFLNYFFYPNLFNMKKMNLYKFTDF